jgi:hypothetical protein
MMGLLAKSRVKIAVHVLTALGLLPVLGCGGGSTPSEQPPPPSFPPSTVALTKLSSDPYSNPTSQHATEVEPDTFAFGSTIVSAFQVGRIHDGGGADIGFATSTDGGTTWSSGFLPGITIFQGGSSFTAVSDASVAYDAAHKMWIICSLAILTLNNGSSSETVVVSHSKDGITWDNPITVTTAGEPDKNWIVCDNTAASPFYGHCYVEWDDPAAQDLIHMQTSTDGGLTWGTVLSTADLATGIGGQPLVQPNGNVIVPIEGLSGSMVAFSSSDGGTSWSSTATISSVIDHAETTPQTGNLRSANLPSAEIDATGTVYVVWSDCRFRTGCSSNDLVLSTSGDGTTWTTPARIPIDPTTSTVDHFIPGLAVDPATSGSTAHLTLTYYYYPFSNCGAVCEMAVGFVSSPDGGQSWSAPTQLGNGMSTAWLPNTFSGLMVADYLSTSYVNGKPFGVFAVAQAPSGSGLNEAMYTTTNPLVASAAVAAAHLSSKGERPVPHAKSDHGPRKFYDEDGQYPIPPKKKFLKRARR